MNAIWNFIGRLVVAIYWDIVDAGGSWARRTGEDD